MWLQFPSGLDFFKMLVKLTDREELCRCKRWGKASGTNARTRGVRFWDLEGGSEGGRYMHVVGLAPGPPFLLKPPPES